MSRFDYSFGIIPIQKRGGNEWSVFLIQHLGGHWSFPKGHPEVDETPLETAKRELEEETGLEVTRLIQDAPFIEKFTFFAGREKIFKTVQYFLAEVDGVLSLQTDEIADGNWFSFTEAKERITYDAARELLRQVEACLA